MLSSINLSVLSQTFAENRQNPVNSLTALPLIFNFLSESDRHSVIKVNRSWCVASNLVNIHISMAFFETLFLNFSLSNQYSDAFLALKQELEHSQTEQDKVILNKKCQAILFNALSTLSISKLYEIKTLTRLPLRIRNFIKRYTYICERTDRSLNSKNYMYLQLSLSDQVLMYAEIGATTKAAKLFNDLNYSPFLYRLTQQLIDGNQIEFAIDFVKDTLSSYRENSLKTLFKACLKSNDLYNAKKIIDSMPQGKDREFLTFISYAKKLVILKLLSVPTFLENLNKSSLLEYVNIDDELNEIFQEFIAIDEFEKALSTQNYIKNRSQNVISRIRSAVVSKCENYVLNENDAKFLELVNLVSDAPIENSDLHRFALNFLKKGNLKLAFFLAKKITKFDPLYRWDILERLLTPGKIIHAIETEKLHLKDTGFISKLMYFNLLTRQFFEIDKYKYCFLNRCLVDPLLVIGQNEDIYFTAGLPNMIEVASTTQYLGKLVLDHHSDQIITNSMVVDHEGCLYATNTLDQTVVIFDSAKKHVLTLGTPACRFQFAEISKVHVNTIDDTLVILDKEHVTQIRKKGDFIRFEHKLGNITSVTNDKNGNIVLAFLDQDQDGNPINGIHLFNSSGHLIDIFQLDSTEPFINGAAIYEMSFTEEPFLFFMNKNNERKLFVSEQLSKGTFELSFS